MRGLLIIFVEKAELDQDRANDDALLLFRVAEVPDSLAVKEGCREIEVPWVVGEQLADYLAHANGD